MSQDARANGQAEVERKSFMALRHPGFRMYYVGAMLAMMADSIEHVISYWMIYDKFQSPALGGFAILSHWLPFLLLSFWSGALADRFDPRRIIQIGMGLFALASLGWGILFITDSLQMWHAVVLLTIHGMAGVLWSPAAQLLVHDIVGRDALQSAIRLMATARHLGFLMGPAIGGVLLIALGPSYAILANALIYLPLVLWLINAPYGPKFRTSAHGEPRRRAIKGFGDIAETIRQISGNTIIVSMILLAGAASFVVGNAHQAQMPGFAHDLGHGEAGLHYSMLLAANAAGAFVGGILLETRGLMQPSARLAPVLVMGWCISIGIFAAATWYPLAVAMMLTAGFFNLAYSSMAQTLVQQNAPQEIRGRVIGLFNMSAHGLRAFSGVTVGFGGSLIGIHYSLGLSALVLFLVTIAILWYAAREARVAAE